MPCGSQALRRYHERTAWLHRATGAWSPPPRGRDDGGQRPATAAAAGAHASAHAAAEQPLLQRDLDGGEYLVV